MMQKENHNNISDEVLHAIVNVWDQTNERFAIPIVGRSMYPLIREGDNVLVECGYSQIRRGDIIAFRSENKLIVHRVLTISEKGTGFSFITKGDNVPHADPVVSHSEIIGKVSAIKRGEKMLSLDTFAGRSTGWLIIRSTPVVRALCGFQRNIFTGNKQDCNKTIVNRGTRFLFLLFRKVIFLFLCRGKAPENKSIFINRRLI
ncbi:signal peptidase I [Candidatus Kuenenia sp.]|uniref:signal peptidase I n=1 Tax=Candidatus Kuenenia sp. TaxID=2499824 RepID=UPI00321FC5AE